MRTNTLVSLIENKSLADYGWQAAVKAPTGEVITGECHWMAYRSVGKVDGFGKNGWLEGFTDKDGVFHSREEALARWRSERGFKIKPVNRDSDSRVWGDSSDLQVSIA